jgi:hypothetical protein
MSMLHCAVPALAGALITAVATAQAGTYTGRWAIFPTITYNCGFGTFQLSVDHLAVVDTYPTLSVTLLPTFGGSALTGTFTTPTTATANYTSQGSCVVSCTVSLQFTSATQLTGSLDVSFTGPGCNLSGCTHQVRPFTGTLQWPAAYATFGTGCAGSLGVPHLGATALPRVGMTMAVALDHLPTNAAFLATGWSNSAASLGPLPFDLGGLGMPGCSDRVSLDSIALLIGANNAAGWSLALPNLPSLLGVHFYQQALVPSPGINALGAVVSDAAAATIGG